MKKNNKLIAALCAMAMMISNAAAMTIYADEGMTAEEAQEQFALYDEGDEVPCYYQGEDGVYYAAYYPDFWSDDFIWTDDGVPAGEYHRTRLLKALCAAYPDGQFAVQFTGAVYADDIQADIQRLAQEGIEAQVFEQSSLYPEMLYAVMTAEQLENFPANPDFGYKMGLAHNPQELLPMDSGTTEDKSDLVTPENIFEAVHIWTDGYENEDTICRWNKYNIVVLDHENQPLSQPCSMITSVYWDEEKGYGSYGMVHVNWFSSVGYSSSDYAHDLVYYAKEGDLTYAALDGQTFQVGDLVTATGFGAPEPMGDSGASYRSTDLVCTSKNAKVEKIGNAMDCFGQDFEKCIHKLMGGTLTAHDCYDVSGVTIQRGDADDSGSLDIVDVIAANRYCLGTSEMNFYGTLAADVDQNHQVDTTDSLMILKEVVEVTKDFVEK